MLVHCVPKNSTPGRCRALLLVFLMLSLTACTAKVSYRFLDWIIAWSVDDYVDWNSQQQRQFDRVVSEKLAWHQSTQLKRYSQFLVQVKQDMQQPLYRELLAQQMQQAEQLWTRTLQEIAPDAVTLLITLSDKQVEEFGINLTKKIHKIEKKYNSATPEKLDLKRIKELEKTVSRFIGRLNRNQKEIIERWSLQLENTRDPWIQSRKEWASAFTQALRERQSTMFPGRVYTLLVHPQSLWSDQYRSLVDRNIDHGVDLLIALQASLTDKQKQQLNENIDDWIETFDELSVSAEAIRGEASQAK